MQLSYQPITCQQHNAYSHAGKGQEFQLMLTTNIRMGKNVIGVTVKVAWTLVPHFRNCWSHGIFSWIFCVWITHTDSWVRIVIYQLIETALSYSVCGQMSHLGICNIEFDWNVPLYCILTGLSDMVGSAGVWDEARRALHHPRERRRTLGGIRRRKKPSLSQALHHGSQLGGYGRGPLEARTTYFWTLQGLFKTFSIDDLLTQKSVETGSVK